MCWRRLRPFCGTLGARSDAQTCVPFLRSSFTRRFFLDARFLEPHITGILVVADAEEDRLTEASIGCPFAELHFDDDFGLDPMSFLVRLWCLDERRCLSLERRQPSIHLLQSLLRESAAGMSDIDEPVLVEVS